LNIASIASALPTSAWTVRCLRPSKPFLGRDRLDRFQHILGGTLGACIVDRHMRAFRGEALGNGAADPARGAGDQGEAAVQPAALACHWVVLSGGFRRPN
jgi:hypothetical protein